MGCNPDAHAEQVALWDAQRRLGFDNMTGAVMYLTSRPCGHSPHARCFSDEVPLGLSERGRVAWQDECGDRVSRLRHSVPAGGRVHYFPLLKRYLKLHLVAVCSNRFSKSPKPTFGRKRYTGWAISRRSHAYFLS